MPAPGAAQSVLLFVSSYIAAETLKRKVINQPLKDVDCDVLVVGFGAAGASCAAQIVDDCEARGEKADVLVCDRFAGGGSTVLSGGIVYLGGGTEVQNKLGIKDDPSNMYAYLKQETRGAVSDETLWRFCTTSADTAAWLRDKLKVTINVADETAILCPFKTSNAPDRYSLFYSGSETTSPFNHFATSAPRGHKAVGPGNLVGTGNVLFEQMGNTVLEMEKQGRGVRVRTYTKIIELLRDESGRISGAVARTMQRAPIAMKQAHAWLAWYGSQTNPLPFLDDPVAKALEAIESNFGETYVIRAKKAVVLSAGGFGRNVRLVHEHVPQYDGCMPIGSAGDDGSGIFELGIKQAGAASVNLTRGSSWKFIVPAADMAKGVLISKRGDRLINEDVYGARLTDAVVASGGGEGFIILDQKIWDSCIKEATTNKDMLFFQSAFTGANLVYNRMKGATLEELARVSGIDYRGMMETITFYNRDCDAKHDTLFGKQPHLLQRIETGPFYAVIVRTKNSTTFWPSPYFTLGGLVVDEATGGVMSMHQNGKVIPGLYAAGRNASGVCSQSYVSGLSLADCVFSGRRAGKHIATGQVFGAEYDDHPKLAKLVARNSEILEKVKGVLHPRAML